jgi:putative aldouronate transport system permease protein
MKKAGAGVSSSKTGTQDKSLSSRMIRSYDLYLMILPVLAYYVIFHYWPMYGVQIAFKQYMASRGIWGSSWVGLKYFERLFRAYEFPFLLRNTIALSAYSLIAGFPVPIVLAISINELRRRRFKKFVQTVTYAPHFISTVVVVGMITAFLSPRTGIVNMLLSDVGVEPIHFMAQENLFRHIYVWSGIWQVAGWSSIIYISALTSVSMELYEAARIDGAKRLQRIYHIDLPALLPTATIVLILNIGHLMSVGFEKVLLMQNAMNMGVAEVISTYVYKVGLLSGQFSFATAVGLFNSVVNLVLLISVNAVVKKLKGTSLW